LLVHRVHESICRQTSLQPGDTVIVGTSGGADSTALLHILHSCKLELRLVAAYVDHGLRPAETPDEHLFIEQLAGKLKTQHVISTVDVYAYRRQHKCSIEAAARTLRYKAFEEVRHQYNAKAIAVAHTADDQAEEILIRLIRGTGLKGLCGMAYSKDRIIRPLLAETKNNVLEYLADEQISYCTDSSNADRTFLRNRIRLDLLPEIERQYNPSMRNTLLQTSSILQQDENLLEELSNTLFDRLCITHINGSIASIPESITFNRDDFIQEHPALQRRLIEKICWQMESRPTFRKIEQLQNVIKSDSSTSTLHFSMGLRIQINPQIVTFSYPAGRCHFRGSGLKEVQFEQIIAGPGTYDFPEFGRQLIIEPEHKREDHKKDSSNLYADANIIAFPLLLRSARPGEKMKPSGGAGHKKITRILSDLKVPSEERPRHPILLQDNEVIAIVGIKTADKFKVDKNSTAVLAIQWKIIENR
jgi:tRNA(Ile)-lysidine synthase